MKQDRTTQLNNTRKYAGIEVADVQDIINYGNLHWGGGSGGGYQPDYSTIGLTSNSELAVIDYVGKKYVDSQLSDKVDKTTQEYVVYSTGAGGGQETRAWSEFPQAYTFTIRDSEGGLRVPTTPTQDYQATSKAYVDSLVNIQDYVESITPYDYSIAYNFYSKGTPSTNEIYFATINGQSVIGKNIFDLQPTLTSDSEIEVKKIWFDNYFIDKPSLSNLLSTVETHTTQIANKQDKLPTYVNDKYLKVVNGALSWEDAGGSGGATYYLHTVSFNTLTSPEIHFQVGVISKNSATYQNFDAFWNDRKKIITLFGTPNMISNALYFNGAMADNFTIKARGITFEDGQFSTDVIDIGYSDIDAQSFGDYGVEEL